MSFISLQYALFFPTVCLLYFLCPYRHRWLILLPASYLFYMAWEPWYILLIIFSTFVDYFVAIFLARAKRIWVRRTLLGISLCSNLGLLFFFKYHDWFANSFNDFTGLSMIPMYEFLLPVGISFYTFQTLAYTIDVYRGKQKTEYHPGYFATYVAFFPQLVAGPIERPQHLLPQFKKNISFDYDRMTSGLKLIGWGLFKKSVVADRLATLVNPVYDNPDKHQSLVVLATIAFGIQIYCDFSGYSDIAIGSAKVMGINLMKNFRAPYRAVSLQDFWRRWHISLSTWFKDYLYKPLLEISKGTNKDKLTAAFIVFIVSGLWHGAAWTFVIWGLVHAAMYSIGRLTSAKRLSYSNNLLGNRFQNTRRYISILITFLMVHFAWIFFRADSLKNSGEVIRSIPIGIMSLIDWELILHSLEIIQWGKYEVFVTLYGLIIIYLVHEIQERHESARSWLDAKPWYFRYLIYQGLIWSFLIFGVFDRPQFIYFQF